MTHRRKKKSSKETKYEVEVIIKEHTAKAYADTGADICVMSRKKAKELNLPLQKTKMRIRPYGSKTMKCHGCYIGTIMYGNAVANVCLYVVKQDVETLLSGSVCEELGIITLNVRRNTTECSSTEDPKKVELINKFPQLFAGVGTLKNYKVKFHIDNTIPPVNQQASNTLPSAEEIHKRTQSHGRARNY